MNTVVALAALKGSPGVTTTALALAHIWPSARSVVVAECDPLGGDLAARLSLGGQGLLGLAADAPGGVPNVEALQRQLVPLHSIRPIGAATPRGRRRQHAGEESVFVFPGHRSASQSKNPLRFLARALSDLFPALDADVLVDCGRLYAESPALVFAERADQLLVVVRPTPDALPRLIEDLPSLVHREPLLVLVGGPSTREMRYSAAEVEASLGLKVVGTIEDDPEGAAALGGRPSRVRDLDRQAIMTSARRLAEQLSREVVR
jgi:hypothetical protein